MKALILAGGDSSRLGTDKSLLQFYGRPSQREFLFQLLSAYCEQVFLSCRNSNNIPVNLNPLEDRYDYKSPLNGIITGLELLPEDACITVPVDMPNIDDAVIDFLIRHRDEKSIATCFYDSEQKSPEPLLTIWEPAALPLLKSFQKAGRKSPRDFLMDNKTRILTSPFPNLHININTKEDMKRYENNQSAM
jgi:molybdenum cofactor guanylyltransferase